MAFNKNINQAGWFYHAPARRQKEGEEAVLYPPMSQIPGLTENGEPYVDPVKPLFRETDTKYVRLAKQGGRANLLQMKENSPDKKEPVGYPRNDWYYLADNAYEDEQEKQQNSMEYVFSRPEYMVHQPDSPNRRDYERPARGPLGYDRLSVFEREQGSVTDKTVKLPELTKPGYGVRSGKPLKLKGSKFERTKPDSAHTDPGRGPHPLKYLALPGQEDKSERPKMNKILSYEYERDYQKQLAEWHETQEIGKVRHKRMTNVTPPAEKNVQSEYTVNFNKPSTGVHSASRQPPDEQQSVRSAENKSTYSVKQNETQRLREARLKKPEEKDLFKMTRFKNVPARITTHRVPAQTQPTAC